MAGEMGWGWGKREGSKSHGGADGGREEGHWAFLTGGSQDLCEVGGQATGEGVLGGGKGQRSEAGGEKGEVEIVIAECGGVTGPQSHRGVPWALGDGRGGCTAEPLSPLTLQAPRPPRPLPSCSGPDPERAPCLCS